MALYLPRKVYGIVMIESLKKPLSEAGLFIAHLEVAHKPERALSY